MKHVSSQSILGVVIGVCASLALATSGAAQGSTTSPFGIFFHTVDGEFTAGGEWSEVIPSAFISSPGNSAAPTFLGDPNANSLLYAGVGQTSAGADPELFLLYAFLPRTTLPLGGETFATVTFPVTLGQENNRLISVLFVGRGSPADPPPGAVSFFDVFVDLDLDGTGDVQASQLGIDGAVAFGPSPLSGSPHLRAELGVPLRIQPNFAPPGGHLNPGGNGINPATGLYDPDPAFWGAAGAGDGGTPVGPAAPPAGPLQPASAGIFTINPDGSTNVQPVPEPSSAALLLAGLGVFGARRRKARAA